MTLFKAINQDVDINHELFVEIIPIDRLFGSSQRLFKDVEQRILEMRIGLRPSLDYVAKANLLRGHIDRNPIQAILEPVTANIFGRQRIALAIA